MFLKQNAVDQGAVSDAKRCQGPKRCALNMQQLYLIQPCGKHGPGADNAPLAVGIRLQRFSFARAGPCGCQEGGAGGHGVCPECPLEYAGLELLDGSE